MEEVNCSTFDGNTALRILNFSLGMRVGGTQNDTGGAAYNLLDFEPGDSQPMNVYAAMVRKIQKQELKAADMERWCHRLENTCRFILSFKDAPQKYLLILNNVGGSAERYPASTGMTFLKCNALSSASNVCAFISLAGFSNTDEGVNQLMDWIMTALNNINTDC